MNCCSNYSYTPLHHASYYGHSDVVGLLLSKGATVDYLTDSDELVDNVLVNVVMYNIPKCDILTI